MDKMQIKIMNYEDKTKIIEVPNIEEIEDFIVFILTGDEIFSISTKYGPGECQFWDAANELNDARTMNFSYGYYELVKDGEIDKEAFTKFLQRKNTYEMLTYFNER